MTDQSMMGASMNRHLKQHVNLHIMGLICLANGHVRLSLPMMDASTVPTQLHRGHTGSWLAQVQVSAASAPLQRHRSPVDDLCHWAAWQSSADVARYANRTSPLAVHVLHPPACMQHITHSQAEQDEVMQVKSVDLPNPVA